MEGIVEPKRFLEIRSKKFISHAIRLLDLFFNALKRAQLAVFFGFLHPKCMKT